MPVCIFEGSDLASMELHPVSLGLGEAPHRRGRPRMPSAADGARILTGLGDLSRPFGTELVIDGARATLRLP